MCKIYVLPRNTKYSVLVIYSKIISNQASLQQLYERNLNTEHWDFTLIFFHQNEMKNNCCLKYES